MKTIAKIILALMMTFQLKAQKNEGILIDVLLLNQKVKLIEFDQSSNLSNSIELLIVPQVGGLFNKSHQKNKGLIRLKDYYHDIDLGVKIGASYYLIKRIYVGGFYNIELLKMSFTNTPKIQEAVMKLSVGYKF